MKKIFDLSRWAPPLYTVPINAFIWKLDWLLWFNEVIDKYRESLTYKWSFVWWHNFWWFWPLRELLAKKHDVEFEQIIIRNWWMDSIDAFFVYINKKLEKSLKKRNAIIVTESPTYDRIPENLLQHRIKWESVMMKNDWVDLVELENIFKKKEIDAFYWIYEWQNPTSYNCSKEKKEKLEELCKKYNVLVLWDWAYHNLTYKRKNNYITKIDNHIIYSFNYTKELSAWAKVWYLLIWDKNIAKEIFEVVSNKWLNPNYPTQAWYYEFILSKYYDENIENLRTLYWNRAKIFLRLANKYLKDCEYNKNLDSWFFINIKFPNIKNHDDFIEKLNQNWIIISDSRKSYHPKYKNMANWVVRIPFAILDENEMEEILARLSWFVNVE